MKISSQLSMSNDCSSQSYGHEFRLKYRKQFNNWGKEQKSRRISESKKERLVQMVTKQNYRIKEAGKLLGISYSTAKKIFTNFRNELRGKKDSETGEDEKQNIAKFYEIDENYPVAAFRLCVVSSIAGHVQGDVQLDKPFYKL